MTSAIRVRTSITHIAILIAVILGALVCTPSATAQLTQTRVYVRGPGGVEGQPGITNPGDSWNASFRYLQDGLWWAQQLAQGQPGVRIEVWVRGAPSGLHYYPDQGYGLSNNKTLFFQLRARIDIYGGFLGNETPQQFDLRNPNVNRCIMNGDIGDAPGDLDGAGFVNYADNSYTVVKAFDLADPACTLQGFTIRGGNSLHELTNPATGGGMHLINSAPRIIDCKIVENSARLEGGGVMCKEAGQPPEFRRCEISRNRVEENSLIRGGGIYTDGSLDLIACRLEYNSVGNRTAGGAIVSGDGTLNVFNCVIRGNTAGSAAGIHASGSSSHVARIANCLIVENIASDPVIGGTAAGIYAGAQIAMQIRNCTVADNDADSQGGGLWTESSNVVVRNSIFWGNTAPDGPQIYKPQSASPDISINDIQGNFQGGNINVDPRFVGGDPFVYALACGSLCLDAGNDLAIADDTIDMDEDGNTGEDSPWDVSGDARVIDSLAGTNDVDLGAHEGAGLAGCDGDADRSNFVDINDLLMVINGWGSCTAPTTGCAGDVNPTPCGDGTIDINDLLDVINNWGITCAQTFDRGSLAGINSALECMDQATELGLEGEEWQEWVDNCIEALCEAGIIDCD